MGWLTGTNDTYLFFITTIFLEFPFYRGIAHLQLAHYKLF